MKPTLLLKGIVALLGACSVAHATVSPDRTRIIFNETDKSVSIKLTNQSKTTPYLAQSWIEDKEGRKTREYMTPLPPLIRLDAEEQSQIRLMGQQSLAQLPADRESLFITTCGRSRRAQRKKISCKLPCKAASRCSGVLKLLC